MSSVFFTPAATDDINQIGDYIYSMSGHLPSADRFIEKIISRAEQYARQPEMGTVVEEFSEFATHGAIRIFSVDAYNVFYRIAASGIHILLICHGARDFNRLLKTRL